LSNYAEQFHACTHIDEIDTEQGKKFLVFVGSPGHELTFCDSERHVTEIFSSYDDAICATSLVRKILETVDADQDFEDSLKNT